MRRLLAAAAAAALVSPVAAAAAGITIRGVDTSAYPRVRVTVVTAAPSKTPPTLTENGAPAAALRAENLGRSKSIVLAVDRSQSMKGKPLEEAVAAARAFVAAKPAADRIAVTTFATSAVMLTNFSSSTIDADTALRTISVDSAQGTKLYDDLVLAARGLGKEPLSSRVIIIVTDGNETRSEASLRDVIAEARKAHTAIYVVAIESSRFTPKPLKELAAGSGGRYYGTASAAALKAVYSAIAQELRRTWRLEFLTVGRPGETPKLAVSVPGQGTATTTLSVPKGVAEGGEGASKLPRSAYGPAGLAVLAFTVGILVLLAYALVFSSTKADRVRARVKPHIARSPKRAKKKVKSERFESLAGLFTAAEKAFGHTRYWLKLQRLIERADLRLKTAELFFLMIGCGFGLGIFFAAAASSTILILLAMVGGTLLPLGFVWFRARRRINAFENQLPDILISMAASMKAGHSFKQGLQAVVDEGYEPAGKEFNRVLTESRLGRPMEAAMSDMADRVGSKNLSFIVTAVSVQTQVGGSLAGLFDMVADTVRNRQQFARKIKALTAMGRMSAYVLIGLPFLVAGGITLMNPGYMHPLFHTSAGQKLMFLGLGMMAVGALMLKKIVSFKG